MSPFWASLFVHLKDCGRNGSIFIVSFVGISGVLILVAGILDSSLRNWFLSALPFVALLIAGRIIIGIRRAIARSRERAGISPMSYDELSKARAKLVRNQNRSCR